MKQFLIISILLSMFGCFRQPSEQFQISDNSKTGERWSAEQANDWYTRKGWLVGCNFAPSTAINQLEMFQAETFDTVTIARELEWAESLGFNSVRVFLHHLLWEEDSAAFLRRLDTFAGIADRHNIGIMFVIFDGVWDPEPKLGKQRDPRPHVHNSGWLQSPGVRILGDTSLHESLEPYVKGVIRHFATDNRIDAWDIFNEPDNPNTPAYVTVETPRKAELSLLLLKKAFRWAREVNPAQPLTAAPWRGDWSDTSKLGAMDRFMFESSDIISFHNYGGPDEMLQRIAQLKVYGRPLLCTEYMARGNNSTFEGVLPVLQKNNVAAYNWGFVNGKSQTIYPWDSWTKTYTREPELWFHDIFRQDGTPYRAEEVSFIRSLTGVSVKQ